MTTARTRRSRLRRAIAAAALAAFACACVAAASTTADPVALAATPGDEQETATLCGDAQPGVRCEPGDGRTTPGGLGTGKVSHEGWPPITGELLVLDDDGRRARGTDLNDEILGGHGSDTLLGGSGRDVIWGDQHATNNNSWQSDTIWGGPGNDLIYPSHGANRIYAGTGGDIVRAYYGRGRIDCGPGTDTAQVRLNGAYKLVGCERVVHFCAHGSDGNGGCRKPGEPRRARTDP